MKPKEDKRISTSIANKSAFAPLLLCAVCMLLGLVTTIIDKFIFTLSNEILAPVLCQIITILLPVYLYIYLFSPSKSHSEQINYLGFTKLRAKYVFFVIFTSLFMICSSLLLNIIFGGVYDCAEGFTLLGNITAGDNEYKSSSLYLIFCYAIIPAFAEEMLFRGLIYKEFLANGRKLAVLISTLIFAIFSFSLGQIPSAILCGLIYTTALSVTSSLLSCIIIHLIFNLYGLFLQTNIAQYYLSSQNSSLLVIIIILAFLISATLFLGELSKIYRTRVVKGKAYLKEDSLSFVDLKNKVISLFTYKPTLIVSIICAIFYISIIIIRFLT